MVISLKAKNTKDMFGIFRSDPIKKLKREYAQLMAEARDIQRSGDLKLYAVKISKAEEVARQIESLKHS
jgi:hypothetical protein